MKGKIFFAFVFSFILFLSLQIFAQAQTHDAPPPIERIAAACAALPGAPAPVEKEAAAPAVKRLETAQKMTPSAPVQSGNGVPLQGLRYYKAAYQAFHFSDSAG